MRALLLLASACSLNTSTLAGSSSPSSSPSSSQPVQAPSAASTDEPIPPGAVRVPGPETRRFYFPESERPADPWSGVDKDKPVTVTLDKFWWWTSPQDVSCTAARDHCLPAASWMWMAEATIQQDGTVAKPIIFTQDGPTRPSNLMPVPSEAFVAVRTVPITRATLAVGARVVAQPQKPIPEDAWADWHVGTVTSVDWDMGFVYLSSSPQQPYFISAVRLPVLQWDAKGRVQILDGKSRANLAVGERDVILPL